MPAKYCCIDCEKVFYLHNDVEYETEDNTRVTVSATHKRCPGCRGRQQMNNIILGLGPKP